ncbi:MAG TPA: methylmalonyl Co-A mutase-associated GTPase MeaB [Alphaproteobacteria bacterium]|nr:methylmalonyl Co-A mutase-associated GTPase MeaB [Alphaproteobacteria bacterium]
MSNAEDRAEAIRNGDRRALARAITLIESTRADHRADATALLESLMPHTGKGIRLGISGAPGVGKSTFIEALGTRLIKAGHRLAVLAVDPTSACAGGSILGDKTRMEELGRSSQAFIRPSPSGRSLGGVARRSREALLLCEAAGFDVVIVETVGVGQIEIAVRDMVDMFVLLLAPAAGDNLQGIKRGIIESTDLLVVNKADGDLADIALRTRADYQNALDLLRSTSPHWRAQVLAASALEGGGIPEVWQAVEAHREALDTAGELAARRSEQALAWMWSEVSETLAARLRTSPAVAARLPEVESAVSEGHESPTAAAADLLAAFLAES